MSQTNTQPSVKQDESVFTEYVLGVHIVEYVDDNDETVQYRFEAPDHKDVVFEDSETALLYADVYFDANGFVESGTGERGVPPELVQAGKDTLAAYLLTQAGTDISWIASFYGTKPDKIEQYISWVQQRAEEVRQKVAEHGVE
ncbi:hypothetical protein [Halorussus sp. AFM4]|uniref:hypothetical protein n=1 Tax=Halorussus sp. AFM4 TaxID=3421651 RepID=UPI003EBD835A